MKRVYIFKDGVQQASTATKESAVDLIRQYQNWKHTPCFGRSSASLWGRKKLFPIRHRKSRPKRKSEMER